MSIDPSQLKLTLYPAPILKKPAEPIQQMTDEVRAVAKRMIEMLYEHDGVGLAGPQVGLPWQIFVTRSKPGDEGNEPGSGRVYINPALTLDTSELGEMEEGCLSLPEIHIKVTRPVTAIINALDEHGNPVKQEDAGLAARVWQHEFDHLNGILIIDRMTTMDRLVTRKTLKALRDAYEKEA